MATLCLQQWSKQSYKPSTYKNKYELQKLFFSQDERKDALLYPIGFILPREGVWAPCSSCLNQTDPCRILVPASRFTLPSRPVPGTAGLRTAAWESEAFPRSTCRVVTNANTRQTTGFRQNIATTITSGRSFPFSCWRREMRQRCSAFLSAKWLMTQSTTCLVAAPVCGTNVMKFAVASGNKLFFF